VSRDATVDRPRFDLDEKPVPSGISNRELLRPLWPPLRRHWHLAALTFLAGWGKFMLPLAIPFAGKQVVDGVLIAGADLPTAERLSQLYFWLGVTVVAIATCAVATYFRSALGARLSATVQHTLRRRLFSHLQRLSMSFFSRHHAGSLGSRVSSDITHSAMVIDKGFLTMLMDAMTISVVAVVLFWVNWWLALIAFAVMACSAVSVHHFAPRLRVQRKRVQESQSSITGRAAEIFAGISLVKAYAGEDESREAFGEHSRFLQNLQFATSRLAGKFHAVSLTMVMLAQVTVLGIGGYLVIAHPGALTVGGLMLFLFYLNYIHAAVQRCVENMLHLQDGMAALERIRDILRIHPDPEEDPRPISPDLRGDIRFDRVGFGYDPARPILHDFDFAFEAGRTYALVGPSGGGKSSLCKLLLRFYDPDSGHVRIDDHDLRRLDQHAYRHQVAIVLQDPILFSTTIEDNIAFAAEDATHADVERAARAAQAHHFIVDLPEGYQSRLGERGVNLSGGQRQRIALARALMREPAILILDEATSSLDSVTERSIQEVIDELKGSRTILIIAHRLSTVKDVDEIVVVEDGRVGEHGTYDELLARDGTFARLVEEQRLAESA